MQRLATLVVAGLIAMGAWAQDEIGHEVYGKGKWKSEDGEERPPWQEGITRIPDYPEDKNLISFEVDGLDRPYRYFLDTASLNTGSEDRVVRYTVVIESPTGVRNVYHEGVQCQERQYKTYAVGMSNGTFRRTKGSQWKRWQSRGVLGYRSQLGRGYLCNDLGFPYPDDERLARLKRGGPTESNPNYNSWAYPGYQ